MNPVEKLRPLDAAFAEADRAAAPRPRKREISAGPAGDIPVGGRKILEEGGLSIGVFHLEDGFYAVRNYCPHQGAELCRGSLHATHRPASGFVPALSGRVLRCPWHGWEFDLKTGKGLYDEKGRVACYPVRVDETGQLLVSV